MGSGDLEDGEIQVTCVVNRDRIVEQRQHLDGSFFRDDPNVIQRVSATPRSLMDHSNWKNDGKQVTLIPNRSRIVEHLQPYIATSEPPTPGIRRHPLNYSYTRNFANCRGMGDLGDIPLPVNSSMTETSWPASTSMARNSMVGNMVTNSTPTNLSSMQEYPWMAPTFGMTPPPPAPGIPASPYHTGLYDPYATTYWQQAPTYHGPWNAQNNYYQWNQNGPPNKGNNYPPRGPIPNMPQQKNNFKPFKLGMKPLSNNFVPSQTAGSVSLSSDGGGSFGNAPENVRRYVERARMAIEKRDEAKLTDYLKKRLTPLINSGAVRMINWDTEPLPHEVNFEIKSSWTPVSQLRPPGQGFTSDKAQGRSKRPYGHVENSPENSGAKATKKTKKQKKLEKSQKQRNLVEIYQAGVEKEKKNKKWDVDVSESKKNERALRFAEKSKKVITPVVIESGPKFRHYLVKGTCQTVEKSFFRLTTAPDSSQVRPLEVLRKALELMKVKYRDRADYAYLSSQLRSIRQDLTVQRIRNLFTITVYETHARICLENKDREEFNQCQNQLKALYKKVENAPNKDEFTAYRLLYFIYMNNSTDILTLLKETKAAHNDDLCMIYALKVREAWSRGYYPRLFKLYREAPRMCGYIMDMFIERERKNFMNNIFKAHRTSIPVDVLAKWLGFEEKELIKWFSTFEILLQREGDLDCKTYANKKLE